MAGLAIGFLVDGEGIGDEELRTIRRLVAMRGDAPYLGVVRAGSLTVYSVALDRIKPEQARVDLRITVDERRFTFPNLGNLRPGAQSGSSKWVSAVVLRLLSDSIDSLVGLDVDEHDAISLVGRALFTRFLKDRSLLTTNWEAAASFDDPASARSTCQWLDSTFNGDFLPLSDGVLDRIPAEGFRALGNIVSRAVGGQLPLGGEESWAGLDFAHIPVGVLSQAYEQHLRSHSPGKQKKHGAYYTPRPIADMMVRGAFHALRRDGDPATAKVLDPAAGAGVFLITALRQLVAERWERDGVRPNTETLRSILYNQLTGFDINESALRFAALGLYLASIELDPSPEPVEKLRFRNLPNSVLFDVGMSGNGIPPDGLGSLGASVGPEHAGRYDLVVGNPPWATATKLSCWQLVKSRVAAISAARLPNSEPPKLPNEVLDLPFLWRAMEWAKPGGQIAFALHARLLFEQGDGMAEARRSVFTALNVTGVVNGEGLRKTKVWPEISAPFCLLFASNVVPALGAAFRFVSPHAEAPLNDTGGFRIDAHNSGFITHAQVAERPELLKIMFRGGPLDLEVCGRLFSHNFPNLDEYWTGRVSGIGYQKRCPSSRVRRHGDGLPGVSAAYLHGLPELTPRAYRTVMVAESNLPAFVTARIHDPRPIELFRGPLAIVRKSLPTSSRRIQTAASIGDAVFSETYYGYSTHGHPEGAALAQYVVLLLGSSLTLWHALVTSGEFGFEREVLEKFILGRTPVPPFESLGRADRDQVGVLFHDLAETGGEEVWNRVDLWVAQLYGLSVRDLQVISDTLRFNLPFASNQSAAAAFPGDGEIL